MPDPEPLPDPSPVAVLEGAAAPDTPLDPAALVAKMREEWDERARENARHYVATARSDWDDKEYYDSGRLNVFQEILTDLGNVCQGKSAKEMTVLEIGCGSGRITRALSEVFGQVYGVDISGEMIRQATEALRERPNAHVFQNNGSDLEILGDIRVDFAFSYIVFQHIPSREVIYSYMREVHRLLRPGGLFKFQVQGGDGMDKAPEDTWLGVPFSDAEAVAMAEACGFEPRYRVGAGTQYFWLWFFRR
ncbi:MAG: class I SAM-dependent methyltransferase [Bryobacteraceae bacterium]